MIKSIDEGRTILNRYNSLVKMAVPIAERLAPDGRRSSIDDDDISFVHGRVVCSYYVEGVEYDFNFPFEYLFDEELVKKDSRYHSGETPIRRTSGLYIHLQDKDNG